MKTTLMILSLLPALPAFGQTMYKCPSPTPGAPPVFQQAPCSPTGGGETVQKKEIKTTGGTGLSAGAKEYMGERDQYWQTKAEAETAESNRQEALRIERGKVRAAEEQAAAQRATARAIWATGRGR